MNRDIIEAALHDFAQGRLRFSQLRELLSGVVELDVAPGGSVEIQFLSASLPRVRLTVDDVKSAIERFRRGAIGSDELANWASMITLLGVFEINSPDVGERTVVWNILDALSVPSISGAHEPAKLAQTIRTLEKLGTPENVDSS